MLSCVWLFVIPWTVAHQAPLSMGFPRQENWSGLPFPSPEKDWRQEEKETTEDEMVGWHHGLNKHEFEHVLGVDDGQGSLARCRPWDHKESDTTEWLNRTESDMGLIFTIRTAKWLTVGCRWGWGVGRTWLSWDGLSVSQRISHPPANSRSSSKSGFRTAKRGRPEARSIPGVLVVGLFMFSWPNQVTWQPRCKSWETDHFLTRESILSPWKSLGLGKGVISNWFFFFFFNLPQTLYKCIQ